MKAIQNKTKQLEIKFFFVCLIVDLYHSYRITSEYWRSGTAIINHQEIKSLRCEGSPPFPSFAIASASTAGSWTRLINTPSCLYFVLIHHLVAHDVRSQHFFLILFIYFCSYSLTLAHLLFFIDFSMIVSLLWPLDLSLSLPISRFQEPPVFAH